MTLRQLLLSLSKGSKCTGIDVAANLSALFQTVSPNLNAAIQTGLFLLEVGNETSICSIFPLGIMHRSLG